jgi:hypothetical protein
MQFIQEVTWGGRDLRSPEAYQKWLDELKDGDRVLS